MRRQLLPALLAFVVFTVLVGVLYPLAVTGVAQLTMSRPGRRLARAAGRRRRRLVAPRSGVRGARVVPAAPFRGRRRLRRRAPARRRTSGRRTPTSSRGRGADRGLPLAQPRARRDGCARRRRHRVGLGARSRHLARRTPAFRRRASPARAGSSSLASSSSSTSTRTRDPRLHGRGARERARAQPRARRRRLKSGSLRAMPRGTLRIYLGAAPGVGKTFAMLNEGRRRSGRAAPTSSSGSSRRTVGHERPSSSASSRSSHDRGSSIAGAMFEEMDVDALLARRPEVALVDELAHTNVPGSRNEKRWQDVEELLEAGIDVISTLNIQHLESLNDVVERITGITQRETIPDEIARRADQVELVDMSPEALRRTNGARKRLPGRAHRRRARQLLPRGQSRRAAGAGAPVGRRPGRGGARRVPPRPRHRAALGDARACRRGADGRRRTTTGSCAARPAWHSGRRATSSQSTSSPQDGLEGGAETALARLRTLVERLGAATARSPGDDTAQASSPQRERSTRHRSCSGRRAARTGASWRRDP